MGNKFLAAWIVAGLALPLVAQTPAAASSEMVEIEVHFVKATKTQALDILIPDLGFIPPNWQQGTGPSPLGLLTVNGIFSPEQAAKILGQLKKAGAEIQSIPKTVALSGYRARIQNVREFRNPSKYSEPNASGKILPIAFETVPVGMTMELEPKVDSPGTIELIISPRIVELTGYSDYTAKNVPKSEASPIWQPHFQTREVSTEVTLYSGQSVLLSGLEEKPGEQSDFIFITARIVKTP